MKLFSNLIFFAKKCIQKPMKNLKCENPLQPVLTLKICQLHSLSVDKFKSACYCKKKGGSENNNSVLMQLQLYNKINKFSQSIILFYYNQNKYASQQDFFSRLQENMLLGDLCFKNFLGEHAPRSLGLQPLILQGTHLFMRQCPSTSKVNENPACRFGRQNYPNLFGRPAYGSLDFGSFGTSSTSSSSSFLGFSFFSFLGCSCFGFSSLGNLAFLSFFSSFFGWSSANFFPVEVKKNKLTLMFNSPSVYFLP